MSTIRCQMKISLAAAFLLFILTQHALAAEIHNINPTSIPCNSYFEVSGNGFGTQPGQLVVNNKISSVAKWSDTEIVGYLPQSILAGSAQLVVKTATADNNASTTIEINNCAKRQGKILWNQRFDAPYAYAKPVLGPDGTIYILDNRSRLYALSPDGSIKWIVNGQLTANTDINTPVLGNTAIDVGDDGTIYGAHPWYVSAISPNGTLKWRYSLPEVNRNYLVYDIKVGPDNNIYIAASHTQMTGFGIFSLTPTGQFRWAVPHIQDKTFSGQIELVFGPGQQGTQLYFSANRHSYAINIKNGDVVFDNLPYVTGFNKSSTFDGTVHSSNYAYRSNGEIAWQSPIFLNGTIDIDSNGIHYATSSISQPSIIALTPTGSLLYQHNLNLPADTTPEHTTMTPDESLLLVDDIYYRLLALNKNNGDEVWRIELASIENRPQYWLKQPIFSPDNNIAYYLAAVNTGGVIRQRTFLYAIQLPDTNAVEKARLTNLQIKSRVNSKGNTVVSATARLLDNQKQPITGATLYSTWILPDGKTLSKLVTTDTNGRVSYPVIARNNGQYTFKIDYMIKPGYMLNSSPSTLTSTFTLTLP